MRKVFLENLPIWQKGNNKGNINWQKSIGYKVQFVYDNIDGKIEIINYANKTQYLSIKYQDKEPFKILANSFKTCALGKLLDKYTNYFKVEIGQVFEDEKRDITIIDRKYKNKIRDNGWKEIQKLYKYKCNRCGFEGGEHYKNQEHKDEYWISEGELLRGSGCACCCDASKIVVPHINSIVANEETHWMIQYFQNHEDARKYTPQSSHKIFPICPDCGRVKDKMVTINHIYTFKSIGCICSDGYSKPNKTMFSILDQLEIKFIPEYSPDWIGLKKYDFYFELKNNKYIVEMDGGLGHGKGVHGKSKKTASETQAEDDYKDIMARERDIEVIRINCDKSELEYMKNNILNSRLIEVLNLSKIDWIKVEKFILSNRVKETCELKKNNPNYTTKDIANIMNMGLTTVNRYLKQGTKLGWCEYNPNEERLKATCKPAEIFRDGISLGVFESVAELSRRSLELFGIELNYSNVSNVCIGKAKQHKGFTFKYITQ